MWTCLIQIRLNRKPRCEYPFFKTYEGFQKNIYRYNLPTTITLSWNGLRFTPRCFCRGSSASMPRGERKVACMALACRHGPGSGNRPLR